MNEITAGLLRALERLLLEFDFLVEGGHLPDVRDDVIFDDARKAVAAAKSSPPTPIEEKKP